MYNNIIQTVEKTIEKRQQWEREMIGMKGERKEERQGYQMRRDENSPMNGRGRGKKRQEVEDITWERNQDRSTRDRSTDSNWSRERRDWLTPKWGPKR